MENQQTVDAPKQAELTPEAKALQNQIGVVQVVERLFRGINAGSFPLAATDDVMAGMSFLSQFHKQLVAQLPPEVVAGIKAAKAEEQKNVAKA